MAGAGKDSPEMAGAGKDSPEMAGAGNDSRWWVIEGRAKSPWLHGVPMAAAYAHLNAKDMERLVKAGGVVSRKKPPREDGSVPRGLLIYAPSIDELIMSQPSGANPVNQALSA